MRLLGGNVVQGVGGFIQLWNWAAQGDPGDTGYSIQPVNYRWLDVAFWKFKNKIVNQQNWYSGSCGAGQRIPVIVDWSVFCRIWWDYDNPPEDVLTIGDGIALKLMIGADSWWTGDYGSDFKHLTQDNPQFFQIPPDVANIPTIQATGLGILPRGESFVPCYLAPLCFWGDQDATCSSEPDEFGIMYQDLSIEGSSLLWYVDTEENEAAYLDYVLQLANQNMIPINPLP
jgi:hypothetical protein